MSLVPNSGWLAALNLPTKVVGGVFLATCSTLALDIYSTFELAEFGTLARPIVIVLTILFGCLLFASLVDLVAQPKIAKMKTTLLAERRKIQNDENDAKREQNREKAIKSLDTLSGRELLDVAHALNGESPSFYTDFHSSSVALLCAKNLVSTPGGTHHQDHYPFSFHDFVWEVLQSRRDEFIAKSEDFLQWEEEKRKSARRR